MQIKLLTGVAGDNFSYVRGDEIDWPDDEDACRMCAAGICQPNDKEAKEVYADFQKRQKTAKPKAKPPAKPKRDDPPENPPENSGDEKTDNPDPALHSDLPVDELDLDETTIAKLKSAELETVGQVASHPDLTEIDGIAKATAKKINQAVASVSG